MQKGRFPSKIALRLKKVCYKVYLCENWQRQSCKAFIGLTIHAKMIGEGRPLLPEILNQTDRVGAKSPIFNRYSAPQPITPSEKSSVNTNRKSTTRFPMTPRWTLYVVPMLFKGGSKTQVSKIWPISCDNSETVLYKIRCQLLLITNKKWHTGFLPTSMILNEHLVNFGLGLMFIAYIICIMCAVDVNKDLPL